MRCNEDTFTKAVSVINDDICSKDTNIKTINTINTISSFPLSANPNTILETPTKSDASENYDSSLNKSLNENDLVAPLGKQNLKNLNYIESEIPIYVNLYKIELERNYTLYEYAVNFIYDKDDQYSLSTPFKQRIINTVSTKVAQKYKNFIFILQKLLKCPKIQKL